jgi:hypothetical protein
MFISIITILFISFILFGPDIITGLLINILKLNEYIVNEYRIAKRANRLLKRKRK